LLAFKEHTRAFLKVQDGCDGLCTYCIVPKVRPDVQSKPLDEAVEEAKALAVMMGIQHRIIISEEIEIPGYVNNPPDRCYFCKSELFGKIRYISEKEGFDAVFDGSNAEDMKDYRPGLKAKKRPPAQELFESQRDCVSGRFQGQNTKGLFGDRLAKVIQLWNDITKISKSR